MTKHEFSLFERKQPVDAGDSSLGIYLRAAPPGGAVSVPRPVGTTPLEPAAGGAWGTPVLPGPAAAVAAPVPLAPAPVDRSRAPVLPSPTDPTASAPHSGDSLDGARQPATETGRREGRVVDPVGELAWCLDQVVAEGASDLHLAVNARPHIRLDGRLRELSQVAPWTADNLKAALYSIMSRSQQATFEQALELDLALIANEQSRFRVNIYQQRGTMGAAFRAVPTEIKSIHQLGLPDVVSRFSTLTRGLVLVTGPTGSGKSTTLAALIDLINRTRTDHIVTMEDPIEFIHTNRRSLVHQREVGEDTHSYQDALKHVLRQDPDVILIGEMRDLETISTALTAAETGHLVFATLHTQSASQTVDRIIDVFPSHQQGQVRAQLATTLQGVVCQTLLPRSTGAGRVAATEVLLSTPAIANLIREGKTYQIPSALQSSGEFGMHTLDQHLADLANQGQISVQQAIDKAQDVETIKQLIQAGSGLGAARSQPAAGVGPAGR